MQYVEDFIDLVILTLVLAMGLYFSSQVIIPVLHEDDRYDTSLTEDKTAPVTKGVSQEIEDTHYFDMYSVILGTQVQDKNMPEPKKVSIKAESFSGANDFDIDIEQEGIFYTIDSKLTGFAQSFYSVIDANSKIKSNTPADIKTRAYYKKVSCGGDSACVSELKSLRALQQDEATLMGSKMKAWYNFISKCNGTYRNSSGTSVTYACTVTKVPYSNTGDVYRDYDARYEIKYTGQDTATKADDSYYYGLVQE